MPAICDLLDLAKGRWSGNPRFPGGYAFEKWFEKNLSDFEFFKENKAIEQAGLACCEWYKKAEGYWRQLQAFYLASLLSGRGGHFSGNMNYVRWLLVPFIMNNDKIRTNPKYVNDKSEIEVICDFLKVLMKDTTLMEAETLRIANKPRAHKAALFATMSKRGLSLLYDSPESILPDYRAKQQPKEGE